MDAFFEGQVTYYCAEQVCFPRARCTVEQESSVAIQEGLRPLVELGSDFGQVADFFGEPCVARALELDLKVAKVRMVISGRYFCLIVRMNFGVEFATYLTSARVSVPLLIFDEDILGAMACRAFLKTVWAV